MTDNKITIDLDAIEKMPPGVIKDADTIRQLSLQSMLTGDVSLLTRINPMFAVAGLYPHVMSPSIFEKPKMEYERRFLLKSLPKLEYERMLLITQYYGGGARYRRTTTFHGPMRMDMESKDTKFVKEIKSTIGIGINTETPEVPLTYNQFKGLVRMCDRYVEKTRYIWQSGNMKWEIDDFKDVKLIVCEVEAPDEETLNSIRVPAGLQEYVIKEITGEKEFTNHNLAKKLDAEAIKWKQ